MTGHGHSRGQQVDATGTLERGTHGPVLVLDGGAVAAGSLLAGSQMDREARSRGGPARRVRSDRGGQHHHCGWDVSGGLSPHPGGGRILVKAFPLPSAEMP